MIPNGLEQFLRDYPGMSVIPTRNDETILRGRLDFKISAHGHDVDDYYDVEMKINKLFPEMIPQVIETGGKIPKNGDYHVNPGGTLCLGSPLRLKKALHTAPDIVSFAEKCIIPYLFNVSIKLKNGGKFIIGELDHGTRGVIQDYMDMFRVDSKDKVLKILVLMSKNRRIVNKQPCPCGCGKRLKDCKLHFRITVLRSVAPRLWFRKHAEELKSNFYG